MRFPFPGPVTTVVTPPAGPWKKPLVLKIQGVVSPQLWNNGALLIGIVFLESMDLAVDAHLAAGLHDTGSHQSAFGVDDLLVSPPA